MGSFGGSKAQDAFLEVEKAVLMARQFKSDPKHITRQVYEGVVWILEEAYVRAWGQEQEHVCPHGV